MQDKEEKDKTITFRVTEEFEGLKEDVKEAAKKVKRSRNNYICWVLSLATKKEIINEE
jgi:uncharacterized protein (DUF1778 family)